MIVRKLRIQRGWSQDQLAQFSGLSVRTIQRIERGKTAGLESLKSLAAVFEVNSQDLQQETVMDTHTNLSDKEAKIIEHVKDIKDFYSHVINYGVVVGAFFIFNLIISPDYMWVWWIAIGWGDYKTTQTGQIIIRFCSCIACFANNYLPSVGRYGQQYQR